MKILAIFFLFICFILSTNAQTSISKSTPNDGLAKANSKEPNTNVADKKTPFVVPKFATPPVIDGKLDDEIWKSAVELKDFIQFQPGDRTPASKQTEVFFGYDERNLYIGIHAFDEPDKVRATVAQRDQIFDNEDSVLIILDTFNDLRRAYLLGFNPLGIQGDGILTENGSNGTNTDTNLDILMESKGTMLADGWSVEVKIPFKSLRYTAGKGKFWGINAVRQIPRFNHEQDSWAPINQNVTGVLAQSGKLTGLDEIKTERTLEIVPTLTVKETGRRLNQTKFSNPPIKPDFGFTAKYSLSPNVTLDAAVNPDFADVEADAPVVEANQRFPIYFDEKRPFFLEGVDIFKTPIAAVNTRQVQNPDAALKLTGKIGKNSFGIMAAMDDPISGNPNKDKAYIGVLRFKRDFGKESHYGFLATSYNFPNKHNQLGGFDFRWKIDDTRILEGQVLGTTSRNYFYNPILDQSNYRTGNAMIYTYQYSDNKKLSGWGIGGTGRTHDYRADVGFTRRTNTNEFDGYKYWSSDPKPNAFLIKRNINFNISLSHDFQGRFQNLNTNLNGNVNLKSNLNIGAGWYIGAEKLIEEEFGPKRLLARQGAFFGAADRFTPQTGGWAWFNKTVNKRFLINANFNLDLYTFDFDFGGGDKFPRVSPAALANSNNPLDPGAGRQFNFSVGSDIKPTDSLSFSLNFNKTKLVRNDTKLTAFDSNIVQFKTTYQLSRFVFLRARVDYDSLSNHLLGQYTFGWTPSPGKAFYVGYNDHWAYHGFDFNPRMPGFAQLDRTFFIKFSYLFRKSF